MAEQGAMLWKPDGERVKRSNMRRFMLRVNAKHGTGLAGYQDLYAWSVANIPAFWELMWETAGIIHETPYIRAVDDPCKMPGAKWFEGARLNFAQNLLRHRDDKTALIFKGEGQEPVSLTYKELYALVSRLAQSLKALGVQPGDRVAGFMPNMPHTIAAMLASASLGALWSSCSPDFGVKGVLDRFGQIRPKVIFCADGYRFKGKSHDSLEKVAGIVSQIQSVERVVVVSYTRKRPDISTVPNAVHFEDFPAPEASEISFAQLPFDHPLYVMYSSGTTGLPKCMVQSAGGILLHHLKEHLLHADLARDDTVFYFTTCGWMMWNWLTSALATGATVVLYDGQPFHPEPDVLWKMAADLGITVFGASAGYIAALMATGAKPGRDHDLSRLRTVLSTGSPLSVEGFEWVYAHIKKDLQLASISGGTDLNGCFALGNPMDPVYAGELQGRGLAMAVEAFDGTGKPVTGTKGELVCTRAFPSMPIYFWDDPQGKKYHAAYFDVYPGIWRHGDFIEINGHGGVVIYGRSDTTLNPGGVRIGTAEIYRVVEGFEEVADSVVVGQDWQNDVRVVLFVKMAEGKELTTELKKRLSAAIRDNASPRHVPAKIIAAPDIPYTLNMKKVELAVKKMIEGKSVDNRDALANPQALDFYAGIAELRS
jgi:acetoacetyl-CoA synthetase